MKSGDFDIVEGVITGMDGRLRCHENCLVCTVCGKFDPAAEILCTPNQQQHGYVVYCADHIEEMNNYMTGSATCASSDEEQQGRAEAQQRSGDAVQAGLFLYVAVDGTQAGPVNGSQLYELALAGVIQADTHVWMPGMAEWVELSKLPLSLASQNGV